MTAAVAGAYGAAAAGLCALSPAWIIGGAMLLLPALWHDVGRLRRPPRLVWHADGSWSQTGDGSSWRLGASTFVSRWLVVLVLVDARGRVRRLALARDALGAGSWRRLVARLRCAGPRVAVDAAGWRAAGARP